jgi:D-3-phosphoglycerate dehydrogenase
MSTVIFSERLGALTDAELAIATRHPSVELSVEPLRNRDEILAAAGSADVLVVGAVEPITADVLQALPALKAIVRRGIGVDNVDLDAATAAGIPVAFVPAATVEEVSDHALALALALSRRLPEIERAVREGDVAAAGRVGNGAMRFTDMTLGVVGFGRIGRALARKSASVFGSVIAFDPMLPLGLDEASGVEVVSLETIWARSHVISLHAPAMPDGVALVNSASLAAMRDGVMLVNTARGQLVDEAALIEAVRSGRVAGAALDVTVTEPLPEHSPLLDCPGIFLTGHTASKGRLAVASLQRAVIDAVEAVIQWRTPEHLANPGVVNAANYRLRGH